MGNNKTQSCTSWIQRKIQKTWKLRFFMLCLTKNYYINEVWDLESGVFILKKDSLVRFIKNESNT